MDHSVRAYLERMSLKKLTSLFENGSFEEAYAVNDAILRDVLEVLIARNTDPGSDLSPCIQRLQEIQSKQTGR